MLHPLHPPALALDSSARRTRVVPGDHVPGPRQPLGLVLRYRFGGGLGHAGQQPAPGLFGHASSVGAAPGQHAVAVVNRPHQGGTSIPSLTAWLAAIRSSKGETEPAFGSPRSTSLSLFVRSVSTPPGASGGGIVSLAKPRGIVPCPVPDHAFCCVAAQAAVQLARPFVHPPQALVHVPRGLARQPRVSSPFDPLSPQLCRLTTISIRHASSFCFSSELLLWGPRIAPI
jgi:hypothetical protein